jgi:hypothetical protein
LFSKEEVFKIPTIFTEEFEPIAGQKHQLLEATTRNGGPQVKIKTILQTCDDVNKNKRIYPKSVLMHGVEKIRPLIEQHALTGEMDHPVPSGNSETDSYRHFVVLYQNTSHIIEDIYFEGNKVMGIVKTASTQKGRDLAGLIMDGVPVGFSLRAMGESEVNSSGITTIKEPFEMVNP